MRIRSLLARLARLLSSRRASRGAAGAAAVTLASITVPAAEAQSSTPPTRPPSSSPRDTVHRYGEKFVLTPTDSVVIRADTVWYPRASGGVVTPAEPLRQPDTTRTRAPRSSGGHASHASHSSHSSHRSMVGYRSGH